MSTIQKGKKGWIYFVPFVVVLLSLSCERKHSQATKPMTAEQLIQQHHNSPVSKSIEPIVESLTFQSVFVGTEGITPTKDGRIEGQVRLKTGVDKQGNPWLYAYTSTTEFSKAFPDGSAYAEMSFQDVFNIANTNRQFAGLCLNSASDLSYPIPRELFDFVVQALRKESSSTKPDGP